MAIVLPHGVLFRGAAEGKIRQILIEKNYLDAIIGVDTFEEEEPIDILEVMKQLEKDNQEIEALEKEIKEQLRILGVEL